MTTAIIPAAGKGIRIGGKVCKQYLFIGDHPILTRTLLAFDSCEGINRILLVVSREESDFCKNRILDPLGLKKRVKVVFGGATRQESVYNGLLSVDNKDAIVVIHDGVRPFIKHDQITAVIHGAKECGACIIGMPAADTLKQISQSGYIKETLEREKIWLAQTPQAFRYDLIRKAHEQAREEGFSGTDDAILVERMDETIKIIKGSRINFKITTQADLDLARKIANADPR